MSIDGDGTLDILATNTGTPATAYSHTRLTAGATRYYRVRRGRFTRTVEDGELLPKSDILKSQLATSLEGRDESANKRQNHASMLPVPSIYSSARPEPDRSPICRDYACMISSFVRARPWGTAANTDSKLLIYGLFQKG